MAKKTEPQEPKAAEGGILADAAKAIGHAAGKLAHLAGVTSQPPASPPKGKLQKKNKSRLPRRQKKALKKSQQPPVAA
jgi:hypothetical protein